MEERRTRIIDPKAIVEFNEEASALSQIPGLNEFVRLNYYLHLCHLLFFFISLGNHKSELHVAVKDVSCFIL